MLSKLLVSLSFILIMAHLTPFVFWDDDTQVQATPDQANPRNNPQIVQIRSMYTQPVDPNGKILLSSWRGPDGSDNDQYVWDEFTLQLDGTITEIDWFGVYDPTRLGAGGPVLDFRVSIYPSIAANTEPAVANPPLVHYQTGGNASEASIGMVGAYQMYSYTFSPPTPFAVSAGVKYWLQIEASQNGSVPDWSFAAGSGGSGNHYLRTSGAGGDILYRFAPGDAAFTLLGTVANPATSTPLVMSTTTSTDIPTVAPTDVPIPTITQTPITPSPTPPTPPCFGAIIPIIILLFLFKVPNR